MPTSQLFDFADASLKGDSKWVRASPKFGAYAPLVVIALAVLSIVEIVLGVVWITSIQSLRNGWGSLSLCVILPYSSSLISHQTVSKPTQTPTNIHIHNLQRPSHSTTHRAGPLVLQHDPLAAPARASALQQPPPRNGIQHTPQHHLPRLSRHLPPALRRRQRHLRKHVALRLPAHRVSAGQQTRHLGRHDR